MSTFLVNYRSTASWNDAIPDFIVQVQNSISPQNLVALSATLGNTDDSCIFVGYGSPNNIHPNWQGLTLRYTTVRTSESWNNTYPIITNTINQIPPQNIVGLSITETPTSHKDCLAIIWYVA